MASSVERRVDELENTVKTPTGKQPYAFHYRDADGVPYVLKDGMRRDISDAEIDGMRESAEVFFVVEYERISGRHDGEKLDDTVS